MQVGQAAPLVGTVRVVKGRLPKGKELRLLFPHWWYGQRPGPTGAPLATKKPDNAQDASFGRWYVAIRTEQTLDVGEELSLKAGPFIAPLVATADFEPIVLLGTSGATDHVQIKSTGAPIRVVGGPPVKVVGVAPIHSNPGAPLTIRFRQEDSFGNPVGLPIPAVKTPAPSTDGIHHLTVEAETDLGRQLLQVGPLLVEDRDEGTRRLVFADLHGHSAASDGAGSAAQWYEYARTVGFLDVAALSDHDWQLDAGEWRAGLKAADTADVPGVFVALPALETNLYGHEVLYFPDPSCLPGDLIAHGGATSLWAETDLERDAAVLAPPASQLLSDCEGSVLTVTHTPLAPGMGTSFPLRDVPSSYSAIEIYSAHGSSECRGCPRSFGKGPRDEPVGSVRNALDSHGQLAFLGTGDSHDGRPGNSWWGAWSGGLTGLWVKDLSRLGVVEAIRSGNSFATTGVRASLEIETTESGLRVRVVAPADISEVVVVRNGVELPLGPAEQGQWLSWTDNTPSSRRWIYLRILLSDGSILWGTPPVPSTSRHSPSG